MALPMALLAAGTAIQIFSRYQANKAQAEAELQNAAFYQDQALFAKQAGLREANLAANRYAQLQSAQVSRAAKGGVDVAAGSMASTLAQTISDRAEELVAIKRKSELDFKLASLRGLQSAEQGNILGSPGFNLMQAGGTLLTNFGSRIPAGGGGSTSAAKPTTSPSSSPAPTQGFGTSFGSRSSYLGGT
jgi:hypothetical protein